MRSAEVVLGADTLRRGRLRAYAGLILYLAGLFGWAGVFPYFGGIGGPWASAHGVKPGLLFLCFLYAHAPALVLWGYIADRYPKYDRTMARGAVLADAALTLTALVTPPALWPVLFAAMGAVTAAGMTTWGRWYATAVDVADLGRVFALAAAAVALIEVAADTCGRFLRPDAGVVATLAPLALAWLALGGWRPTVHPSRMQPPPPAVLRDQRGSMVRFALFIVCFSLVAGLSFQFFVVAPLNPSINEILRRLPYVVGLLLAGVAADRRGLQTPVVAGSGLLALAFLVGAWRLPSLQYVSLGMNGTAFGLLEAAPWLLLAANARPGTAGRWFGWGLNLNVVPILVAGMAAPHLPVVAPEQFGLIAAVALVLATLLLNGAADPLGMLRATPPEPERRRGAGPTPLDDLFERRYGVGLTPRELEAGRLAVLGVPTRDIAERLFVAESTVKTHLRGVYRKTGSANRIDLLRKLVTPSENRGAGPESVDRDGGG